MEHDKSTSKIKLLPSRNLCKVGEQNLIESSSNVQECDWSE